ncbi:VPLPA-CTERM-specific exosortase XrtD [Octadecabacter sp. CECT 8868]|uniref:VPLPA-CTERM-specific exosortase XrtD n=1 Tax=Octadecabacter algicola TaxID=2909342 RepID=UPI001F2437D0|nr:VPLPA-CTERM-specific exosortase XrtD [Octadecabacter algicola]MCF2906678.1 VPLPA-CTERM-specific exosortase XrtD [Octadecabacter algicola]
MALSDDIPSKHNDGLLRGFATWGLFWLSIAIIGAFAFFADGIEALFDAWQLPEYSHGPLIPVLSGFLFLKQLKDVPVRQGQLPRRWPGVALILFSLVFGLLGKLSGINDLVAYALILWVGGILLVSWGWDQGKHFWVGVVHLVYMLPLPGVVYYKITTILQAISSELGVWFLALLNVPVFLDGNIIDLGVTKLHVAEACSGLRYMFPIMSFSYIFACLYQGPRWHKAVLLLSAVPIAIFMNSVRIAVAGLIVQYYGLSWLEGFSHFFEGWVIFIACILILFGLAIVMLRLNPAKPTLSQALDIDFDGIMPQLARLRNTFPSRSMITAAILSVGAALVWFVAEPDRGSLALERDPFTLFPRTFDSGWRQDGARQSLPNSVLTSLGADDFHQVDLVKEGAAAPVGLFMAWYDDQSTGGVHSPEICLPGSGWEIAWLERTDISAQMDLDTPFNINRAIIQKGEVRMMVFYYFQQKNRTVAWDFAAKMYLMIDGIRTGRTDGALVRLTTPILSDETDAAAEARLMEMLQSVQDPIPRFIPL